MFGWTQKLWEPVYRKPGFFCSSLSLLDYTSFLRKQKKLREWQVFNSEGTEGGKQILFPAWWLWRAANHC